MKKILVTLATLFSSQVFSSGNTQAMQGRFNVNTSRCSPFQKNTPAKAFVSVRSSDSLLVELIGSEGREIIVHTQDGEDMGRNGRESYEAKWPTVNTLVSTRTFVNDNGKTSKDVVTLESVGPRLTVSQVIDGRTTLTCELNRLR